MPPCIPSRGTHRSLYHSVRRLYSLAPASCPSFAQLPQVACRCGLSSSQQLLQARPPASRVCELACLLPQAARSLDQSHGCEMTRVKVQTESIPWAAPLPCIPPLACQCCLSHAISTAREATCLGHASDL